MLSYYCLSVDFPANRRRDNRVFVIGQLLLCGYKFMYVLKIIEPWFRVGRSTVFVEKEKQITSDPNVLTGNENTPFG